MSSTKKTRRSQTLSWTRQDIEQRFLFKGGRYTSVNSILSVLLAMLLTGAFYGALIPFKSYRFADMFLDRWVIPVAIVFFSFWCLVILFIKSRKLRYQKRALIFEIVPQDADFVLTAGNVDNVFDNIYDVVDDPKHFVLFNRISVALSNLKNLGRIGDVGEILESQADSDESAMETSYSLISGFIWAIPVLGFIGTVLGLSEAIGEFGLVLKSPEDGGGGSDMAEIKDALKGVTGGLSMAFVTTLQALVAALFIQIILTFLKKSEQEFLDTCSEYCTTKIVNRLRIQPFERGDHQ